MMNFALTGFLAMLKILDQEIRVCQQLALVSPDSLADPHKSRIVENLKFVSMKCREMSLPSAEHRLDRIYTAMNIGTNYSDFGNELIVLKQSIEDDVQFERFYHYPKELFNAVLRMEADWAATFIAFPSKEMKFEVSSGVDCYALGQPTSAIFHFMRAAEFGLRALARERRIRLGKNKPIEWATWQQILQKLGVAQKAIESWKAGNKKDAALSFYTGAIASLHSFKNEFRNMVMHVRKEYEMEDAAKALRQVRDFTNDISQRVGENTRGSIRKWV
jgi:hypothetical protein